MAPFWQAFTRRAICSNCALRSGCCFPSIVFLFACRLNPCALSNVPTLVLLTANPSELSASARVRVLLHVHRSGNIGSPRLTGSIRQFQGICYLGLKQLKTHAAASRPPLATDVHRLTQLSFGDAVSDRAVGNARRSPDGRDAAPAKRPGFRASPSATTALVQFRRNSQVLISNPSDNF